MADIPREKITFLTRDFSFLFYKTLTSNHLTIWPLSSNDLGQTTERFGPNYTTIWPKLHDDLGQTTERFGQTT